MHKRNILTIFSGLLLIVITFACSAPAALPSATPPASATPSSSPTLTPTYTATATLQPTLTPTATPTSMLIANAGHVVRSVHFDDPSELGLVMDMDKDAEQYSITDSHFVLIAKNSPANVYPWETWEDGGSGGRTKFSPQVGHVSVFLFRVEENTYFGYHFEVYESTADGVQYKGINLQRLDNTLTLYFRVGNDAGTRDMLAYPVHDFQYGAWYYYSLQVQPDGLVTAKLWERDQPDKVIFEQTVQLDAEWAKPGFTFVVTSVQGKMEVDEYQEVELPQ